MLELAIAHALYDRFPDFEEGQMAKLRSQVVSRASCAVIAEELGLGTTAPRAPSRAREQRRRRASPATGTCSPPLLEAALAALYLEHGFEAVAGPIVEAFERRIEYALTHKVDHKTELQEELARRGRSVTYALLDSEGPAHERTFTAAALIDGVQAGVGKRQLEEGRRAGGRARGARGARSDGRRGSSGLIPVRLRVQTCPRVHLKAIKLRGFKSFVDPVEVHLEPGVAVVVGPNGSGKSNISDAILWATGSLSPHELRAEKPDDVLFAGSAGRKPVDFCEVELVFDNDDGAWPELPFSEVSLARRLHRGGEGQYLVNRAAVRRIDLIELLSDVGLGGGLRSVISQGSVETVLGAKPAERRGARRGGGRARPLQAPPPPRRAEAGPGRDAGRARARSRGRGAQAAPPAGAPGDRSRARREARGRDRRPRGRDRDARPRGSRRAARCSPRSVAERELAERRELDAKMEALLRERSAGRGRAHRRRR